MMELRPNCECCDKDLPWQAADAMICTFECTFCADCATDEFGGICPNCGGGLVARPIRPARFASDIPAASKRVLSAQAGCLAKRNTRGTLHDSR
jgi:uncharacterized protein